MKPGWLLALLLPVAVQPMTAQAFSDPERFAEAAAVGGGGGRYFTGSPEDGHTCVVCHGQVEDASATVFGLPVSGYLPGRTYDVELTWPDDGAARSTLLELVDETGQAAGDVSLLDESETSAAGRCGQQLEGGSAGYLREVGRRQVLGLEDCGARSLRFRWTAPAAGTVIFAGAIVRSNRNGDLDGDGVTELSAVFGPEGSTLGADGCSAGAAAGGATLPWLLLAVYAVRRRWTWTAG